MLNTERLRGIPCEKRCKMHGRLTVNLERLKKQSNKNNHFKLDGWEKRARVLDDKMKDTRCAIDILHQIERTS